MSKKLRVGLLTLAISAFCTIALAQSFTTFINARVTTQLDLQGTLTANGSTGTAGQFLTSNGAGDITWTSAPASPPGGLDTYVQYNDGGVFGGDAGLTFDEAADRLTMGFGIITGARTNATAPLLLNAATTAVRWAESDATTDNALWEWAANGEQFRLGLLDNTGFLGGSAFLIDRTGTVVDSVTYGATQNLFSFGTAASPSISFTSDADNGLYRFGANQVGMAAFGQPVGYWEEFGLRLTPGGSNLQFRTVNPTSYMEWIDSGTSTIRSRVGDVAGTFFIEKFSNGQMSLITANGNLSLAAGGGSVVSLAAPTQFTSTMRGAAGTAATPSFSFTSDTDDGFYHSAANTLGFSTEGVERVTISSSGTTMTGLVQAGSSATVGTASFRSTEFVRFYNNGQGIEFSSPGSNVFNITQHDGTFYNTLQLTANDLQFSDSGGTAVNMTPVKGNFTVDFTAQCSASTTITVEYFKIGASVTLNVPAFSCTSTTSSLSATGTPVPSAIRPTASITESAMFAVTDLSTNTHPGTISVESTGAFRVRRCGTSAGTVGTCADSWNSSGSKGIQGGVKTVTYLKY